MHMHQDDLASCTCMALRKASRVLTSIYDRHLARHHITITQFSLLKNLLRHGNPALSALADLMVMDRTTLYRSIEPLEKAGWVKIKAAEKGNIRIASLTKSGRAKLAIAEPDWKIAQDEISRNLGTGKLASLHAASSDIIALAKD